MAFSSATHDIAADGFYMLGLTTHEQALFVGIRSTFLSYSNHCRTRFVGHDSRISGKKQPEAFPTHGASRSSPWQEYFLRYGSIMPLLLPRPANDKAAVETSASGLLKEFLLTFRSFFPKRAGWYCYIIHASVPVTGSTTD